MAVWDGIFEF